MSSVSFRIEESGEFPFIDYLHPDRSAPFFLRLFLRGPGMDRALGNPQSARSLTEASIPRRGPLVAPQQVHGTATIPGTPEFAFPSRPAGDGVLLEKSGVEGSLRFADCFPIVIASLEPSPWIAILHSGYKGVVSNIAGRSCESLFSSPGRTPSRTFAWIGPGIGRKHYNRKRADPWTLKGLNAFAPEYRDELDTEIFFDLGGQIRRQLLDAGLPSNNLCSVPLCTFERNDLCYSYRNGDIENRLFLLAFLSK